MSVELREVRKPDYEGVIFLIHHDGKVLLERRNNPDKVYYGYTIIPAGKVKKEENESFIDAVRREIKEECDITPGELINLDTFLQISISNHFYRTTAFLVTDYKGRVRNVEGKSEHIWVNINKASEMLPFADSKHVINLAKDYLLRQNS